MLKKEVEAQIPTKWGEFRVIAYRSEHSDYSPELVLVHPDCKLDEVVDVRIHSECITGDLFHSEKCDCGSQLDYALDHISNNKGVLIYLRQEGRGIGIINKLKAYNKQSEGMDTVEANLSLGLENDYRRYDKAISILTDLGISRINLLTNNPDKLSAFDTGQVQLVSRIPVLTKANDNNLSYLRTKQESLGHLLGMD